MTLEEAIKHCEEVAKNEETSYKKNPAQLGYVEEFYDRNERAKYHRQLAAWLKELKALKRRMRNE